MVGTGVPYIVLHFLCSIHTSRGYFRSQKSVLSNLATFGCFWVRIGWSLTQKRLVKMIFLHIRLSEKSILALEPKFHGEWCKNGHATRRKSENTWNTWLSYANTRSSLLKKLLTIMHLEMGSMLCSPWNYLVSVEKYNVRQKYPNFVNYKLGQMALDQQNISKVKLFLRVLGI